MNHQRKIIEPVFGDISFGTLSMSRYVQKRWPQRNGVNKGITITIEHASDDDVTLNRLLVYFKAIKKMMEPKSVSKELAEELLACKENRRSMKLEQIFNRVLDRYPDGVTIKDIDVMFNPDYKVDVLKILIAARKRKKYSVIWPGRFDNGKLYYSDEGYADYKVYDLADYDITCVI